LIGNAATEKEPPTAEELEMQIRYFGHMKFCATSRKARVEDLMQRRSANGWRKLTGRIAAGWNTSKKTQMVRRLMRAGQEIDQADNAIGKLTEQLTQIKEEAKKANNVAPFIPPPATSV
jgi:hypothetical protein